MRENLAYVLGKKDRKLAESAVEAFGGKVHKELIQVIGEFFGDGEVENNEKKGEIEGERSESDKMRVKIGELTE